MNSSKTFALLKLLNKKENVSFRKELQSNKRKILVTLFDLSQKLIKHGKDVDLKAFFELFYKEKYNKSKDNAFRNELRILNGLLEQFIVNLQIKNKLKEDYYFAKKNYLDFLLERQELHQLNIELVKIFKRIDENEDYIHFHDFFIIWTRYSNFEIKMDVKHIEDVKEKFKEYFDKWRIEVGLKTRKFELFNAFIERSYFMVSRTMEFSDKNESISLKGLNSVNYYNYLGIKADSYKHSGDKKLSLIEESIVILNKIKTEDLDVESEKYIAYQFAGIEYLIQAQVEKAIESFENSLKVSGNIDDINLIKGLYNYASASIKIENYEKAIEIYETYQDMILKYNIKDMFSCIFTMCYVFRGNLKSAEYTNKIISSNSSVGNYIYSRCNLAIIFYLNSDSELALNELTNINQTINYHKNQDKTYLDFISSFRTFINFTFSKSLVKENKEKLVKLETKLKAQIAKSDVYYGSNSLHMMWLIKEIESKLSS